MKDQDQIYRDLQKDLNQQPVGFPATKSGSEIRLLKRFFNPGEARVAMTLSYRPRPLREIYEDVREKGIAFGEVRITQNAMANKGGDRRGTLRDDHGPQERNSWKGKARCETHAPKVVLMRCETIWKGIKAEEVAE